MSKKIIMLGLGLMLIGGGLFEWTRRQPLPLHQLFPDAAHDTAIESQAFSVDALENYQSLDQLLASLKNTPPEENKRAQKIRLMTKIAQLATEDVPESALTETLYGPNWKGTVLRYKRLTEQHEFATIASILFGVLGILMTTFIVIYASIRSMMRRIRRKKTAVISDDAQATQPDATPEVSPLTDLCEAPSKKNEHHDRPKPLGTSSASTGGALPYRREAYAGLPLGSKAEPEEVRQFDLFLTDEGSLHSRPTVGHLASSSLQKNGDSVSKSKMLSSLETRTEDVARQLTHVQKQVTEEDVQAQSTPEPFNETLQQLNDQISSIRQYASSQQDRVEKLQTGYDWNIIRTFCLRIIRCIDNLDGRIERLPDDSAATEMLCDIRDELLFSLESSGVERFDLDLGSEFCGQERLAEAIKEKESSDDPALKGRIARVVKSGYQYIIDDENVKVVRTARIKLYG